MLYAIGDIHGRLSLLNALLGEILEAFDESRDRLVFVGDYIDRGEDSRGVITRLETLRSSAIDCVFLRGNHEQLMLDARHASPPRPGEIRGLIDHSEPMLNWLENGGTDTLLSYRVKDFLRWWESIPNSHWQFVDSTQMELLTDSFHIVHAGLLAPGQIWEGTETDFDPRLWIREPFLSGSHDFGRTVVFGHTPQSSGRPLMRPGKIGIDTAAAYGGPLTAVCLDAISRANPTFLQAMPGGGVRRWEPDDR